MALLPVPADLASSIEQFADGAAAFFENIASIAWGALAIALVCHLLHLLCRARGWSNALKAAYPATPISFRRVAASYMAGAGVNSVIPARAGDVVKIFLARNSVENSSYPAVASSFAVESIFDITAGMLVLGFALTQGLLPDPPDLPSLPAFEISFWADHPRFLIFCLTAAVVSALVAFIVLAKRAELFWARVKQGLVILADRRRYLREVAAWQLAAWWLRFGAFFFFLEAFHIGGSFENVLLVMSVQAISTMLPLTPGGAGAQQALLVATLGGASQAAVLSYSVGQQIAIAAWTALLGFAALFFVFRRTDWRAIVEEGRAAREESAV